MIKKITLYRILYILVVCSVFACLYGIHISNQTQEGLFKIVFLDVGQGDSVFIEDENGFQILIDGGRGNKVLSELSAVMPFYDRSIDVVVATHGDADHIGGLIPVFDRYKVDVAVTNMQKKNTNVYRELIKRISKESKRIVIDSPKKITTSNGTEMEFLWPLSPEIKDANNASVVTYINIHGNEILLTGDISKSVEDTLTNIYTDKLKDIEILKVAHHGSKTSSSSDFIEHTSPDYSVISYGKNNRYGHPHEKTLQTLKENQSEILLTVDGQIEFAISNDGRLNYSQ